VDLEDRLLEPGGVGGVLGRGVGIRGVVPPEGFASWEEWFGRLGVPEDEWDDGASLDDPDGVGPRISFMKVPDPRS
jgi:hypothetical protein